MKKYSDYTFLELVERIGNVRLYDAPKMIKEAFLKLKAFIEDSQGGIESISGDFVNNSDPLNPIIDKGYKSYVANITFNTGLVEPTVNFERNELGVDVTWVTTSSGKYGADFSSNLDINKIIVCSPTMNLEIFGTHYILGLQNISQAGLSFNGINVETNTIESPSNVIRTTIEIRVYS